MTKLELGFNDLGFLKLDIVNTNDTGSVVLPLANPFVTVRFLSS